MSKQYQNIDELFKAELGTEAVKAPALVKKNIDKQIRGKSNKWAYFLIPALILAVGIPLVYLNSSLDQDAFGKEEFSQLDLSRLNDEVVVKSKDLLEQIPESNGSKEPESTIKSLSNNKKDFSSNKEKNESNHYNITNKSEQSTTKKLKLDKSEKDEAIQVKDKIELPTKDDDINQNKDENKTLTIIEGDNKTIKDENKNVTIVEDNKKSIKDEKEKEIRTELVEDLNKKDNLLNNTVNTNPIIDSNEVVSNTIDSTLLEKNDLIKKDLSDSLKVKDEITLIDSTSMNELVDSAVVAEINKDKKKGNDWTIDAQLFGGIDFIKSKFTSLTPEAINNFDSNKIRQLSGHFGLAGNINYKNISLGLGASFYKVSDEAEYSFYNYTTTSLDSTQIAFFYTPVYDSIGVQIDSLLDSTTTIFNYTVQDSSITSSQVINTYKIFAIPLSFGYTFNISSWAIKPRLSGIFEFSRQTVVGNYPLLGAGNSGLDQLQGLKFGFSLGLDVEIRKYFGQFYALARPGYRLKLTNTAFNGSSGIKHNSFNAVVGIGFHFGR